MRVAVEDGGDDVAGRGADALAPAHKPRGRPLEMRLVRLRPVRGIGGVASLAHAPEMDGDAFALVKNLEHRRRQPHVDRGAQQRIGHAIEVPLDRDVVVDVHLGGLPLGKLVRGGRQRAEGGPIDRREQAAPGPGEFLKRAVVEHGAQPRQLLIQGA